jgi:hypothetical protein
LVAARFFAFFAPEPVAAATFAAPLATTFMTADWRAARRVPVCIACFSCSALLLTSLPHLQSTDRRQTQARRFQLSKRSGSGTSLCFIRRHTVPVLDGILSERGNHLF